MKKKEGRTGKKQESTELKKQLEDYKETLQRLQAEFENFQKRVEKENASLIKYGNASIIKELLPVLDSIESCAGKIKNEEDRKGVLLIKTQLLGLLQEKGLAEIKTNGEKFNHELHEVMMQDSVKEKEDMVILEEFQKGYMLHDKVLRHAKVKINKKDEN